MYGIIRMINFARMLWTNERASGAPIETMVAKITAQLAESESELFTSELYLRPVVQDDALLFALDFDDSEDVDEAGGLTSSSVFTNSEKTILNKNAGNSSRKAEEQLRAQVDALKEQLAISQNLVRNLLRQEMGGQETAASAAASPQRRNDPLAVHWQGGARRGRVARTSTPESQDSDNADDCYFESYSNYKIHQEMIKDGVRTEGYRDVILKNAALFKGKVVLDVGCGTAILSMFAARAGATRVIGIDNSEMAIVATKIVAANNLQDVVTIVKAKVEDLETLPHGIEKVDIIISEWMGYCLFFENMLDSVLIAKQRWLIDDGLMLPSANTLTLEAADDSTKRYEHWADVYGFDMTSMKSQMLHSNAYIEHVPVQDLITERVLLRKYDLHALEPMQATGYFFDKSHQEVLPPPKMEFALECKKDGTVREFVVAFDTHFETGLHSPLSFATHPEAKNTHWMQCVLCTKVPIAVRKGDKIVGSLQLVSRDRDLDIHMDWCAQAASGTTGTKYSQSFRCAQ